MYMPSRRCKPRRRKRKTRKERLGGKLEVDDSGLLFQLKKDKTHLVHLLQNALREQEKVKRIRLAQAHELARLDEVIADLTRRLRECQERGRCRRGWV